MGSCHTYGNTHSEYRGLAPTGKKIVFTGIQIYHVVDGKATEVESVYGMLDFFKQLGAIEYTQKAKIFFSKPLS